MKRVFWKIGSSNLELIGRISVGNTDIEIAADGNLALGLINGYRVVDSNLYEKPLERIVPALASITAKIFRDKWAEGNKIQFFRKEWDSAGKYPSEQFMTTFFKALVELLDSENVEIVDVDAPVRAERVRPKVNLNLSNLATNLAKYQTQLAETVRYMDRALERSQLITRRKLVATMWGADKVQAILDSVRAKIQEFDDTIEFVEEDAALCAKSITRVIARINAGAAKSPEDMKYLGQVLIPSIQDPHDEIQKTVATLVAALAPLSVIDKTIREYTGSPAAFFLSTSVLDDFRDAYKVLVEFLASVPQMESGIFTPLDYIKGSQMVQKAAGAKS